MLSFGVEAARLQIAKDCNQWKRDNGHRHKEWCPHLRYSNCSQHQVSPLAQDQLTGKLYTYLLPVARRPLKHLGPCVWQNTTCVLFRSVHPVDAWICAIYWMFSRCAEAAQICGVGSTSVLIAAHLGKFFVRKWISGALFLVSWLGQTPMGGRNLAAFLSQSGPPDAKGAFSLPQDWLRFFHGTSNI